MIQVSPDGQYIAVAFYMPVEYNASGALLTNITVGVFSVTSNVPLLMHIIPPDTNPHFAPEYLVNVMWSNDSSRVVVVCAPFYVSFSVSLSLSLSLSLSPSLPSSLPLSLPRPLTPLLMCA